MNKHRRATQRRLAFIVIASGVIVVTLGSLVLAKTAPSQLAEIIGRSGLGPTPTPLATPPPTPILDRLQIEAIRSRKYTASTLTVTEDLGDQGGYRETVSSFVSDGLTQYALVSTPSSAKPTAGWPVIILAHGYINPKSYVTDGPNYASFINELARAGYLVIKPDYRGHGRSQGAAEGGHFSPVYTYDVLNLIETVKHYPGADPKRIGLLGHSMGGHVALRTIVASKDIKATVLMSGVVGSMNDIFNNWPHSPAAHDQPSALVRGVRESLFAQYGMPQTNPTFWESASAINFVNYVRGPVQINHSVGDGIVPVTFARHLNAALTAAHKPVELYEYPGNDHQFSINHKLLMQRMLAFYAAHL